MYCQWNRIPEKILLMYGLQKDEVDELVQDRAELSAFEPYDKAKGRHRTIIVTSDGRRFEVQCTFHEGRPWIQSICLEIEGT